MSKNTRALVLFFFLCGCSGLEFVYDSTYQLNSIRDKTEISVSGDDSENIYAYLVEKINSNYNNADYLLSISSKKNVDAVVIKKDATASKFKIEHIINYNLRNIEQKCDVANYSISTYANFNSKSAGYSFGTDVSEKENTIKNLRFNINKFFNKIANKIDLSCNNEN